jgi:hypothetical protein
MGKFKTFFIWVIVFLLICFFTPLLGKFYELLIGYRLSSGFWGTGHPEYFEGFFISYSFFVTLAMIIFGGRKKYWILAALLVIIFLIQIVVPESLIISAGASLIAWLIAQAVLFLKKKISKK